MITYNIYGKRLIYSDEQILTPSNGLNKLGTALLINVILNIPTNLKHGKSAIKIF